MQSGDLVQSKRDVQNGFDDVFGLVVATRMTRFFSMLDCCVVWSTETTPIGWWREDQLEVVCEIP